MKSILSENMTFLAIWESKAYFLVENDRIIKKLHNNDYRKICSLDPLKEKTTYRIKFRILQMGTIAIGLVPTQNKGGLFIDNRYTDALKFITFANQDGGKLMLNGEDLHNTRDLAMRAGDEFEMIFDAKAMTVTIKTNRMRQKALVDLSVFKEEELYLFLEMKQQNTCIEFLTK